MDILTFGHSTLSQADLSTLIRGACIARVVDVRTVPKSRAHPWVWTDKMEVWVPAEAGAEYLWERELGGFRSARNDSRNTALRNASFRAYADYMETDEFRSALDRLIAMLPERHTAIMCSETLWWRCHRRLISDALVLLHDIGVAHLMANARTQPHVPTAGVRRDGDMLRYDVAA